MRSTKALQCCPSKAGDLRVATPGGVFQVRWDNNASASALGQLAFLGEFLEVTTSIAGQHWLLLWPVEGVIATPRFAL